MLALAALALNIPMCAHERAAPEETAEAPASDEFIIRSSPSSRIEAGAIPEPAAEAEAPPE
jgi:hypothetical protein